MSQRLCCAHPPALALHQQAGDEVFGLVRDVCKLLLLKVPLTGQDVVQCLVVIIPQKRRQATEPGTKEAQVRDAIVCLFKCTGVCE